MSEQPRTRRIRVDELARVEGEGALYVRVRAGGVAGAADSIEDRDDEAADQLLVIHDENPALVRPAGTHRFRDIEEHVHDGVVEGERHLELAKEEHEPASAGQFFGGGPPAEGTRAGGADLGR